MPASIPSPEAAERRRLFGRCLDFETEIENGVAEKRIALDGMTALLCPSLPRVWDANFLRVERAGVPIADIAAAADETIGGEGMKHRAAWPTDPRDAERLETGLTALGWEVDPLIYMALTGEPDRLSDVPVEEVRGRDIAAVRAEAIRVELSEHQPGHENEDAVEQLVDYEERIGDVAGDRWFSARDDGQVGSICRLYEGGGVGQVETVSTLPAARGLGLARSVVLAAMAASTAAGNETTFIIAAADDWPQLFYSRLGFEPIGSNVVLRRKPDPGPG